LATRRFQQQVVRAWRAAMSASEHFFIDELHVP
jgi:hypothetical protein